MTNFFKIFKQKAVLSLLLLALVLRLFYLTTPLADWHSFRQADTASVTREYLKHSIDLLRPKYHDLSNIQSGKDNLEGYRMVEFPFINALTALLLRTFTFLPLVPTSRVISLIFSLGTVATIFYLVKSITSFKQAYLTSLLMAIMPYSVFYSRAVLPEAPMLFFSTFSIFSFYQYLYHHKKSVFWFALSLVSLALALLLKPFVAFLAPVYLFLWLKKDKFRFYLRWPVVVLVVSSFLPLMLWRQWIGHFPTGIPASDWLFNGNGIRLRPAWFRWLFYHRFTQLITGYGSLIMPLAFLSKWKTDTLLIISWWLSILAYLVVIATGNVQHDYYQVLTLPVLFMTLAKALVFVWDYLEKHFTYSSAALAIGCLILFFWFNSYQQVKGYFNINHWEYIKVGKIVDQTLPIDAKVIAPAMGDTVFLFQTNRTGWPIGFEIEDKISKGAEYYVSTSMDDETKMLMSKYQVLEKTDEYAIIKLR